MLKNKVPVLFLFAASHLLIFSSFSQVSKIKTIIVDAGHGGTDVGAVGQYENSLRSKEKDVTLAISKKLVAELKRQLPDVNIVPTRTTDIYQHPTEKARIANENKGNLFICIHADSGPLKTGRRQIGTRMVTRYKYVGKGKKKRKKIPYEVEEPVYEYFKMPLTRNGTSVWIFAAHKTSDKLKAIMKEIGDFEVEADGADSSYRPFDINSAEGKNLANIYATRFQLRSDRLATFVNDEVEKTGRPALGVNQRQAGIWVLQATNMPAILVETGFINNPDDERYLNSEQGQQELAEAITKAVKHYKEQVENSNKTVTPVAATPANEKNIPQVFENRANKEVKVLQVKSDKIKVDIYDDGEIDNDIVSVSFNRSMILEGKKLTARPHTLNLDLAEGRMNELVLYADNLGDIPPNTALMIITDGTNRYEVRLSADMKNNASIKFELKK